MLVKTGDLTHLDAPAKAVPADDVVTRAYYTRLPQIRDEAEVTKNKLSMGLDLDHARGIELLMALWKISDVWME
jgi:crotonobetainyl-CoA:carnitine CoA-transferase CaiB-like acyl-CoA transferase